MRAPNLFLALALAAPSSWGAPSAQDASADEPTFESAAATVQRQLEDSIAELDDLRKRMADEKIPLGRELTDLESQLSQLRLDYQQATRLLDSRVLDLTNLRSEIRSREDETAYLSNLLGEYVRSFESRLHIAELQRYEADLEGAKLAAENTALSDEKVRAAQAVLLDVSLDRLLDALGGTRFEGTAVDPTGLVDHGTYVMVGPAALFLSEDGLTVGTAEQRLGSLEPTVIPFARLEDAAAAKALVENGEGLFTLDPTLGNAHKVEATEEETLLQEIRKGGAVMYPIFALAGAALLVALFKWIGFLFVRKPSKKRVAALLEAVSRRDEETARAAAGRIRGPVGRMLTAGVEHMREPRELIEEVMYETVLTTRLKLNRMLPFIAISAASAPLLGLLGTVTGIISTFKLITVFGSGDVKMLSGGISEALITTKYGLIVAIPSLLIHAFLSRKARGMIGRMETAAVAFVNQLTKARNAAGVGEGGDEPPARGGEPARAGAVDPEVVRSQVKEILSDMLVPMVRPERDAHVTRPQTSQPV